MQTLYDRPMSAIPVSIGTSLALESLFVGPNEPFDPNRTRPSLTDLKLYNETWFNVSTIIRNIAHSVPRETYFSVSPEHVLDILLTEISVIEDIFQTEGRNVSKLVFYHNTYKRFKRDNAKELKFREPSTTFTKHYDYKEDQVLQLLKKKTDQVLFGDSDITSRREVSALMFTHLPLDLTFFNKFRDLVLLESHTGKLKQKSEWNTKYAPLGEKLFHHMPFTLKLLKVFGDRYFIAPSDIKLRRLVYDLSVSSRWTTMTRDEKINQDIRFNVAEHYVRDWLLAL